MVVEAAESLEPRPEQGTTSRTLALLAGAGAVVLSVPLLWPGFFPLSLPLLFLVVPAAQFALTPLWRLSGAYRYHSPMLFTVARGTHAYELHGGTPYDYVLHMRWSERGPRATRTLLRLYLAGLLGIITEIEQGRIPGDARITGTSYFFSDRTMRKLGFRLEAPGFLDRLHLLLDVLSLVATYSYARGRLTLPRVWRARQATITAAGLAERRAVVQQLYDRLATPA
jgi:hypothetical protein